jgi:hypothetical protein
MSDNEEEKMDVVPTEEQPPKPPTRQEIMNSIIERAARLATSHALSQSAEHFGGREKEYVRQLATLRSAVGVVTSLSGAGAGLSSDFSNGLPYGVDTKVLEIDWKRVDLASERIALRSSTSVSGAASHLQSSSVSVSHNQKK